MKKILLLALPLLFFFSFQVNGQEYSSSIGLRAGLGANVTYKTFMSQESALEAMVGFYFNDFYAGLAYEKHNHFANDAAGLTWYWGVGGTLSLAGGGLGLGALGALGLEYAFNDIPLNISIDWMPHLYLIGNGSTFRPGGGGVALRYILNR